jgi:hypothetical protein
VLNGFNVKVAQKHVKPLDCLTQTGIGAEFQNENEKENGNEFSLVPSLPHPITF